MKWRKRFGVELIAVIVMIAVVSVLAVYQYRWTGEISRTEQARLRNSLATSVRNFDQEFSYDFQQLCESFELDPEAGPSAIESRVTRQQASWTRTSAHAELVKSLYIWKTDSSKAATLEFFDPADNRFHDANCPPELESMHRFLTRTRRIYFSGQSMTAKRSTIRGRFSGTRRLWFVPSFEIAPSGRDSSSGVHTVGVLIVASEPRISRVANIFPDLVDRHFGAPGQRSFVVSVRTSQAPYQTIYLSDAKSSIADFLYRRGRQSVSIWSERKRGGEGTLPCRRAPRASNGNWSPSIPPDPWRKPLLHGDAAISPSVWACSRFWREAWR